MPVNKNAFIRYRVIDRCLRNHNRKWTKKDITQQVNSYLVSRFGDEAKITDHTIRHDLDSLEYELDAPLERYPPKNPRYYRYSDLGYSAFNVPFSPKDIAKLTRAMETLSSIKGLELAEEILPIISYLQSRTLLNDTPGKKVLFFDHQPTAEGTEYMEDLLTSIQQKTAIKIQYKPFNEKDPVVHHFHPYVLKEFNSRWFCLGYCSICKQVMNLGLDRIVKPPGILKEDYIENTFFNAETYFTDIIGVTRPAKAEKEIVILEISGERFPYIKSKPIHQSQTIEKTKSNGSAVIKLDIILNKELISTILGFGKDIKVISPTKLIDKVRENLRSGLNYYSK